MQNVDVTQDSRIAALTGTAYTGPATAAATTTAPRTTAATSSTPQTASTVSVTQSDTNYFEFATAE